MSRQDLTTLFSGENFRWQMRFEKGEIGFFFSPTAHESAVLIERKRWLGLSPADYAALEPQAIPLLTETIDLAHRNRALTDAQVGELREIELPFERACALGGMWESDFALLGPSAAGGLLLYGGVVCFPSSWSLPEKIGKPMQSIHSPVPQLNEAIGRQIDLFLSKLRPGAVWLRSNWGIVRSPELNHHPSRNLSRLTSPVRLGESYLRIERQCLIALPQNAGVLFGINVEQLTLAEVKKDGTATASLVRSLSTMDENIAAYKGFGPVRTEIIDLLK